MNLSSKRWGFLGTPVLGSRKRHKNSRKNGTRLLSGHKWNGFEQLEDRCLLSIANGLDLTSSTASSSSTTTPIKAVELASATNVISLEYDLPTLVMQPTAETIDGRIVAEADMPGTSETVQVGQPILPLVPVEIVVPYGHTVGKIDVVAGREVTLSDSYFIQPRTEPLSLDGTASASTSTAAGPVNDVSATHTLSSEGVFHVLGIQEQRGVEILRVNLNPVQYAALTGEVSYYTSLTLNVNLVNSSPTPAADSHTIAYRPDPVQPLEAEVANPDALATYTTSAPASQSSEPAALRAVASSIVSAPAAASAMSAASASSTTYQYVAITSQAMIDATTDYTINDLIAYKQSRGMTATVVSLESIYANYSGVDQQEQIRNFIIDAYNNWGTDYVLLGGDTNVLPSARCGSIWACRPASSRFPAICTTSVSTAITTATATPIGESRTTGPAAATSISRRRCTSVGYRPKTPTRWRTGCTKTLPTKIVRRIPIGSTP